MGPLLTGASSGLSSFGVNKALGSNGKQGGFLIHKGPVSQLIPYITKFTPHQRTNILKAVNDANYLILKPTPTQRGGFIGSLLASIGIMPLLINALTVKGMQTGPPPNQPYGYGLQVDPPGYYQ